MRQEGKRRKKEKKETKVEKEEGREEGGVKEMEKEKLRLFKLVKQ